MAAPIVLISSSPPSYQTSVPPIPSQSQRRQDCAQHRGHSLSPPDLPSPTDLIGRARRPKINRFPLKSGSKALPVPEGVITGFASAGRLLRENVLDLGSVPEIPQQRTGSKTKARPKHNAKSAVGRDADPTLNAGDQETKAGTRGMMFTSHETTQQRVEQQEIASLDVAAASTVCELPEKASVSTLGLTGLGEAAQRKDDAAAPLVKVEAAPTMKSHHCISSERQDCYDSAIPSEHAADSTSTKPANQRKRASRRKSAGHDIVKNPEARRKSMKRCDQGTGTGPIKKFKKTGTSSHHFSAREEDREVKSFYPTIGDEPGEPLDLDIAPARRRSWTPTKNTAGQPHSPSGFMLDEASSKADSPVKLDLSTFAYPQGDMSKPRQTARSNVESAAARKRRFEPTDVLVVEADDCGSAAPQSKVFKRPKTITERVIAPFRQNITKNDGIVPVATLNRSASVPDHANTNHRLPSISGSKGAFPLRQETVKSRKSSKKPHKSVLPKVKLLSPEAFGQRLDRQDIVFATASQLINESPTYLKQYQQAIRMSEVEAIAHGHHTLKDPLGAVIRKKQGANGHFNPPSLGAGLPAIPRPVGGLWSADTRVDDEVWAPTQKRSQLAVTDVTHRLPTSTTVDKSVEPGTVRRPSQSTPPDLVLRSTRPLQSVVNDGSAPADESSRGDHPGLDDSYLDIDELIGRSFERSSSAPAMLEPPLQKQIEAVVAREETLRSPLPATTSSRGASARLRDWPQRRSALEPLDGNACIGQQSNLASKPTIRAMHTSTKPSDDDAIELELEPTLKRPRGRPKKGSTDIKASTLPTKRKRKPTVLAKAPPQKISKAKVVTPTSTSSKSFVHIDEIEDSEPEISPSPRRRTKKAHVTALELVSSQGELFNEVQEPPESRSAKFQFEKQQDEVYARITRIVKSAPRTSVPSEPSWHEKILLYDPIVLEDFTIWLNSQGATYTKSKAVNHRPKNKTGKSSKDGASEDANTAAENTQFPLEAWMVQKWCEAYSVCCLWREGLRGGVKAKY